MTPPYPRNILLRIKQLARMCRLTQESSELPDEIEGEVYELETNIFIEFVDHFISNDHLYHVSLEEAWKASICQSLLQHHRHEVVFLWQACIDEASS